MSQTSFGQMAAGYPGQRVGLFHHADSFINDEGYAAEVVEITVGALVAKVMDISITGTTDGVYTATINGIAYTFTASSNTAAQIATGLAAAINAPGITDAVASSTHVTLTAAVPGTDFTATVSGPAISISTTTPNAGDGSTYTFTVSGETVSFVAPVGSSVSSIRTGLVDSFRSVNSLESLASVTSYGTNKLRITNKQPGTTSTVVESDSNLNSTVIQAAGTPQAILFGSGVVRGATDKSCKIPTGTGQEFLGIVERVHNNVSPYGTYTGDKASPFQILTIGRRGKWLVLTEVAVAPNDPVYIRHTANGGKLPGGWGNTADSSKADLVSAAKWRSTAPAGGYAIIELNLP